MKPKKVKIIQPKPPKPTKPTEIKVGSIVTGRFGSVSYPGMHDDRVSIDEFKCVVVSESPLQGLLVQRYTWSDETDEGTFDGPECFVPVKHLQLHEEDPAMIEYVNACEAYYDEYGS